MSPSRDGREVLKIGPVRFRRLLMAAGWPVLGLAGLGRVLTVQAIAIIVVLGALASYRALRMSVILTYDEVIVHNLLQTRTLRRGEITRVSFSPPRSPGWPMKLEFSLAGSHVLASGVSVQSDALEAGVSVGRSARQAVDQVKGALERNGLPFDSGIRP